MFNSIYEVKISGKDVKRFVKQIYKLKIFLYEINYIDKNVYIKLDKNGYNKLLKMKTIYDIELIKVYGLERLKYLVLKNYIFFCCLLFGFCLLIFLTRIISNVEVIHSNKEIRNLIYKELEKRGIKKNRFLVSFDKSRSIAQEIMDNHRDKIEWLEIERVGVKYIVRVEERIINNKKNRNKLRHIVAKKDGIITSIEASSGEVVKKKNDFVKKGDIIVSGNILKSDEIKSTVSSEGKVYAEVWYDVNVEMPFHYKEIKKATQGTKNINVLFLGKELSLFNKYKTKEKKSIVAIKNSMLPIGIELVDEYKTNIVDLVYTIGEATVKAMDLSEFKLKEKIGSDAQIISRKKLKTEVNGSTILLRVFFKVNENITSYKNITDLDIKRAKEELKKKD